MLKKQLRTFKNLSKVVQRFSNIFNFFKVLSIIFNIFSLGSFNQEKCLVFYFSIFISGATQRYLIMKNKILVVNEICSPALLNSCTSFNLNFYQPSPLKMMPKSVDSPSKWEKDSIMVKFWKKITQISKQFQNLFKS